MFALEIYYKAYVYFFIMPARVSMLKFLFRFLSISVWGLSLDFLKKEPVNSSKANILKLHFKTEYI